MKQNKNRMLFLLLPLIFLLCFFIWQIKADRESEIVVRSDTPVWDLRPVDMSDHYVRLAGGVAEYVPEAFLLPEEFEGSADIQIGEPKYTAEYYTARIKLLVPDGRPYAITFSSVDYADSIYLNGRHMQTVGQPGESAADVVPQTLSVHFTVYPENGVIEVLHQSSNFVHKEGGNPAGLRIGSLESIGRYFARDTLVSAVILGACLLLCIVHFALFALQKSYRANLYFALFCLVWALRVGVTGSKAVAALFPGLPWQILFRAEYTALPVACILIVLALSEMFAGLLQRPVRLAILSANAVFALLFLFAPTLLMTYALPFAQAAALLSAACVIVRFLLRLKTRRDVPHVVMLSALVVFVYLSVREVLYHNNILIFPVAYSGMMDFAALILVLFQMVAAFYGTMREVEAAKEREIVLAAEKLALEEQNLTLEQKAENAEALLRRAEQKPGQVWTKESLTLDAVSGQAFLDGRDMLLSPKEFSLLSVLAQHEGEVLAKAFLYEAAWKQPLSADPIALKNTVSRLRKKLGGGYDIASKRGEGYVFLKKTP